MTATTDKKSAKTKKTSAPDERATPILIPQPGTTTALVSIKGVSGLICNRNPPEYVTIQGAQQGGSATPNPVKNPFADDPYESSCHFIDVDLPIGTVGRYGFPSFGIKSCAADAASRYIASAKITKVKLRGSMFVLGELVPLQFDEYRRRDDPKPNDKKQQIISKRVEFTNWSTQFYVQYNPAHLTLNQILQCFAEGGQHVGLGSDRPGTNGGQYGRFVIEEAQMLEPDTEPVLYRSAM